MEQTPPTQPAVDTAAPVTPTPVTTPPVTPPTTPPMGMTKPKSKGPMLLLIVGLLIILVGGGGYYFYANSSMQPAPEPTVTATPTASSSAVASTSAKVGTNTYVNTKTGFQIDYPNPAKGAFTVHGPSGGEIVPVTGMEDKDVLNFSGNGPDYENAFLLELIPYTGTLSNAPKIKESERLSLTDITKYAPMAKKFTVDGKDTLWYSTPDEKDGSKLVYQIFMIGNSHVFIFHTTTDTTEKQMEAYLSTFKFTDAAQASETNTYPGEWVTFQYPNGWEGKKEGNGCGPVISKPGTNNFWITDCGLYSNPGDTPQQLATQAASNQKVKVRTDLTIDGHKGIRQEIESTDGTNYNYDIYIYVGDIATTDIDGKGKQSVKATGYLLIAATDKALVTDSKRLADDIIKSIKIK